MAVDFLAKRDIIEQIIPSDATSVSRTSGVSGAWSAYGQIISAANLTDPFILCGAYVYEAFAFVGDATVHTGLMNIQVAIGEAGSEVVVAESHGVLAADPADATAAVKVRTGRTHFFEPILIPANTRIAYRASSTDTVSFSTSLYLFGYDARYFAQPLKVVDELRYIRGLCSPTRGATVWPSPGVTNVAGHNTVAWTYGTPVQFIASAATPLLITGLSAVAAIVSNRAQAKIGIGAPGSEQWVSKVGLALQSLIAGPTMDCYLPRPLYVKTGEAVSVMIASSNVSVASITGIALKGFALK
jgi:hypothetical protein